jgi:hypothetical protein
VGSAKYRCAGLEAKPWWEPATFGWTSELEDATPTIRAELASLLRGSSFDSSTGSGADSCDDSLGSSLAGISGHCTFDRGGRTGGTLCHTYGDSAWSDVGGSHRDTGEWGILFNLYFYLNVNKFQLNLEKITKKKHRWVCLL